MMPQPRRTPGTGPYPRNWDWGWLAHNSHASHSQGIEAVSPYGAVRVRIRLRTGVELVRIDRFEWGRGFGAQQRLGEPGVLSERTRRRARAVVKVGGSGSKGEVVVAHALKGPWG